MTQREKDIQQTLQTNIANTLRLSLVPLFQQILFRYDDESLETLTEIINSNVPTISELLAKNIYDAISSSIRGLEITGKVLTTGSPTSQQTIPGVKGGFFSLKKPQYSGIVPNYLQIKVE